MTPREALAAAYVAGAVGVLQEPWGVSLADWLQTAEGKEALAAVGGRVEVPDYLRKVHLGPSMGIVTGEILNSSSGHMPEKKS